VHLPGIVDILVRSPRTRDADAIFVWFSVIGTEAFQPEFACPLRWVQMEERWNKVDLAAIIFVRLPRKSEQEIPRNRDMIVRAPLEADNILHRCHALVHRPQLIVAQALQPRLHALDPSGGERSNLVFMQVALGFDEHIKVAVVSCKSTEEVLHIFHVDDVVHQSKSHRIVSAGKIGHLPRPLLGRFGAKLHALRIQSTKRTVMFFSPPTAARTFVEEDSVEPLCGLPQLSKKMIVIIIIGWAGLREVREEGVVRSESDRCSLSIGHAAGHGPGFSLEEVSNQL